MYKYMRKTSTPTINSHQLYKGTINGETNKKILCA